MKSERVPHIARTQDSPVSPFRHVRHDDVCSVMLGPLTAAEPVNRRKQSVCAHLLLHAATVVFTILALVAIGFYKSLNVAATGPGFPFWTLFSPHSWLGLVIIIFWVVQFFARIGHTYWLVSPHAKAISNRLHIFFGKAIFVGALATCALGFQDMQSSDLSVDVDDMAYQPLSVWANYACASVILLLVLGISVLLVPEMEIILDLTKEKAERADFEKTNIGASSKNLLNAVAESPIPGNSDNQ